MPGVKDLGHQRFMYTFECRTNEIVGANGLSDGEERMSNEPGVAIGWFLESIVNNPRVPVVLNVINRGK